MLSIYYIYTPYLLTLYSYTYFLSSTSSFALLYTSLAYFNLLIHYSIFFIYSIYTSFSISSIDRLDLYLLPIVRGIWLRDSRGGIYNIYAVDTHDISDTNAILLSTILICDIVCLLNIVDNSILGICYRFGLGVLNRF